MNIIELYRHFEEIIKDAEKEIHGGTAVRTFTIYKDVIMYLIANGKLTMSDGEEKFWNYTKQYALSALYRVAEYYRKENRLPPLGYKQMAYRNKENTLEEWSGLQS